MGTFPDKGDVQLWSVSCKVQGTMTVTGPEVLGSGILPLGNLDGTFSRSKNSERGRGNDVTRMHNVCLSPQKKLCIPDDVDNRRLGYLYERRPSTQFETIQFKM